MVKRTRKAPKRKAGGAHKKHANAHHTHEADMSFDTAPLMETRILTEDEKHELIRAHAEERSTRKGFGMGYYTAIVMCCLVVGGGWIATLRWNFGLFSNHQDPAIQTVQESIESFRNNAALRIPEAKKNIQETKELFGRGNAAQAEEINGATTSTKQ